jgi:hypothetical protein
MRVRATILETTALAALALAGSSACGGDALLGGGVPDASTADARGGDASIVDAASADAGAVLADGSDPDAATGAGDASMVCCEDGLTWTGCCSSPSNPVSHLCGGSVACQADCTTPHACDAGAPDAGDFACGPATCTSLEYCVERFVGVPQFTGRPRPEGAPLSDGGGNGECVPIPAPCAAAPTCACITAYAEDAGSLSPMCTCAAMGGGQVTVTCFMP